MQLTLDNFTTYTPPKSQLLKWVGNKQRYAAEITRFFPKKFNSFYEPFLGSGAVLATVSPRVNCIGSDYFEPLIEIWNELKNDPDNLIKWYSDRRDKIESDNSNKKEVYDEILSSFNSKNNGADFLFLTRSCYGSIVRFRKKDGHMSTPCGVHTPISTKSFAKRVKEWHNRMKDNTFITADYNHIFDLAKRGDLIYCDPPYKHSQAILYGAQKFSLENLFDRIHEAKKRGVFVALSIDGIKKSGKLDCELNSNPETFDTEIFIELGRSMLRRFQMEGESLESELVSDRLLLNYNLPT